MVPRQVKEKVGQSVSVPVCRALRVSRLRELILIGLSISREWQASAAFQPRSCTALSGPVFLPGRNVLTQGFNGKCGSQGKKADFDLAQMLSDGHVRTFISAASVMAKIKTLQMAIPTGTAMHYVH